jgi:hypothetical protein
LCPLSAGKCSSAVCSNSCLQVISTCCLQGTACLAGTSSPATCPAGFYCIDGTKSTSQHACPAGYRSSATSLSALGDCLSTLCPVGHYCPAGSTGATTCPIGTFNAYTGGQDRSACTRCTAGYVCTSTGLSAPDGNCLAGYYCPMATSTATNFPCLAGTYTFNSNATKATDCDICPAGFACPRATGALQSWLPCASGHFCPPGTPSQKEYACPAGKYANVTNATSADDCMDCPLGWYCTGGQGYPTAMCQAGYTCVGAAATGYENPCPKGTWSATVGATSSAVCQPCPAGSICAAGSALPTQCPAATYAPNENTTARHNADFSNCLACPAGMWCGIGTIVPTACASGTYSTTGQSSCTKCMKGYYCNDTGISDSFMYVERPCPAGYWCPTGTALAVLLCTQGYHCPQGSAYPVLCSPGSYANTTGQSVCWDCPAGSYCRRGSTLPNPACATGHYCPALSSTAFQLPCPPGTFSNVTGLGSAEECQTCPAGRYCPSGTSTPIACPAGSYCIAGVSIPEPCSVGTYNPTVNVSSAAGCTLCSPGKYCNAKGLTSPSGPCDAGYYCTVGAPFSAPGSLPAIYENVYRDFLGSFGNICPSGGYCPAGTATPLACPMGTYLNETGLDSLADCRDCPPGLYCDATASLGVTGRCNPGYYCTGAAYNATQHVSPAGTFSQLGFSLPQPCSPGTYQPQEASTSCVGCEAGKYCPLSGMTAPYLCPSGGYCLAQSAIVSSCPSGTYQPYFGANNSQACIPCPAGSYCQFQGASIPVGLCEAGYFCETAAELENPLGSATASSCPPGKWHPYIFTYSLHISLSCLMLATLCRLLLLDW